MEITKEDRVWASAAIAEAARDLEDGDAASCDWLAKIFCSHRTATEQAVLAKLRDLPNDVDEAFGRWLNDYFGTEGDFYDDRDARQVAEALAELLKQKL